MDQENSLRAKQSELENSIFKTKQKEVCDIGRTCFLDKFRGKLSHRSTTLLPQFSSIHDQLKMCFLSLPITETSGAFHEANKEDRTYVDGKISIVAKIYDGAIGT